MAKQHSQIEIPHLPHLQPVHPSNSLAQFGRSIYNAVEKPYCSLRWHRLLPSLVSVATAPLAYMGKVTFSHYLLYFQPVSEHTSLAGWKQGGETQHQINSQISTGPHVSTIETMPSNTSKAGEGHHSQHQPSYGRFSHFHRCKARELLGYSSFSNIFIDEKFYLQKSDSQCRQYWWPAISAISWQTATYLENQGPKANLASPQLLGHVHPSHHKRHYKSRQIISWSKLT